MSRFPEKYNGSLCKTFFMREQNGRHLFSLQEANLMTESDSLYPGLSWDLLPYNKNDNDEVLFLYQQLMAAGHHGVPGKPAPLHAGMEYR